MLFAVRPLVARLDVLVSSPRLRLALIVTLLWIAAETSSVIGVHPVFGAFVMGAIAPRSTAVIGLARSIDAVNTFTFLPLFFIFSGLQTRIGLVNTPGLWMVCLAILSTAVIGKLLGCTLAMRATRANWRESLALGVLMNTRL